MYQSNHRAAPHSAGIFLPGKTKAASANISTAGETTVSLGEKEEVSAPPPPPPPLPPPSSSSPPLLRPHHLLQTWTRWFPGGRRGRRERRCRGRSTPDSVIKHNIAKVVYPKPGEDTLSSCRVWVWVMKTATWQQASVRDFDGWWNVQRQQQHDHQCSDTWLHLWSAMSLSSASHPAGVLQTAGSSLHF